MEAIMKTIKEIRKQKGYSHEYLAHELDISQAAYSKLEKNDTKLTIERLYKIAMILEVDISELLDIKHSNQFNQTNKENATRYLQKIEHFYQENKEQNQKIIELYETRIKDKDKLIERLEKLV